MFCNNCGNKLAEDARFCTNCGAVVQQEQEAVQPVEAAPEAEALAEATPVVEAPVLQEQPEPVAPVQAPTVEATSYALRLTPLDKLKKACKSPLMLIAALLYTVFVVLQLLPVFGNTAMTDMATYMTGMDPVVGAEMANMLSTINGVSVAVSLVGMLPIFLIALGLWVNYFSGFGKNGHSTAGLTMVKTSMVLRLIGKFFTVALGVLVIVLGVAASSAAEQAMTGPYGYYDPSMQTGADVVSTFLVTYFAVLGGIVVFSQALPIAYDFVVITCVNSMKTTANTNQVCVKGFGAMTVFNGISVFFAALGLLFNLAMSAMAQSIISSMAGGLTAELGAEGAMMGQYMQGLFAGVFSSLTYVIIGQVLTIVVLLLCNTNLSKYKKDLLNY